MNLGRPDVLYAAARQGKIDYRRRQELSRDVDRWKNFVCAYYQASLYSEDALHVRWAADSWLDLDDEGLPVADTNAQYDQQSGCFFGEARDHDRFLCAQARESSPAVDRGELVLVSSPKECDQRVQVYNDTKITRTCVRVRSLPGFGRNEVECASVNGAVLKTCDQTKHIEIGETSTNSHAWEDVWVEVEGEILRFKCSEKDLAEDWHTTETIGIKQVTY